MLLSTIPNNGDGTYSLDAMRPLIRGADCHEPKTTLAIVENTHNVCGGRSLPLDWLDQFAALCDAHGLAKHMDGARIFNAAAALGVPVARIVRDIDSMTFCLSKGLCAPVGSVLVGSAAFVQRARHYRKALGGGMRQAGHLAAAGLVALDDIVPHLQQVHERTRRIARAIGDLQSPFVKCDATAVDSNICMLHMVRPAECSSATLAKRLQTVTEAELKAGVQDAAGNGIIVKASGRPEWNSIRFVLYHHIDDAMTDLAIAKITYCIKELL